MSYWTTKTDLYNHQKEAVSKLAPLKVGAFFMEMGLGKSRCYIEIAKIKQGKYSNIILFCPVAVMTTIRKEIEKHTTCNRVYMFGASTTKKNIPNGYDWYIVGIESMSSSWRVVNAVKKIANRDTLVFVDESDLLSSPFSNRTTRITKIALDCKYRFIGTGTPMTEGVKNIYSQMYLLSPKILGYNSYYSFSREHLVYHPKHKGLIIQSLSLDLIAERISPYCYQVTKKDAGVNIPDKSFSHYYTDMTYEQSSLYDQVKSKLLAEIDLNDFSVYDIFRLFTALQQVASGFYNDTTMGDFIQVSHNKLDLLTHLLNTLEEDKVVIWCKFKYSIDEIYKRIIREFGDNSVVVYNGDMNEKQKQSSLKRFAGNTNIIICSIQSGQRGLNELSHSHNAIFYECPFSYRQIIQAEGRQHRIGQKNKPHYIRMFSDCGIDDRIERAVKNKTNAVKSFRREMKEARLDRL